MSDVLRLMSSRLATLVSRPAQSSRLATLVSRPPVVRVPHAHSLGGRARESRALRGLFALALALGLCGTAFAATNSFTYAATFGHYANGTVERCPISGDVDLTVSLYASDDASAQALWSHRLTTTASDGDFVVDISDTVGVHDETCPEAMYELLDRIFQYAPVRTAVWVEISNARTNGVALSELATGALRRGKITGVPFAVVATRAESARGSFRVTGKATVSVLKATGRLNVTDSVELRSSATFKDIVRFNSETVSVTGTLHKTSLENLGTLVAGTVVASGPVTANVLAITNGVATTLTPPILGSLGLTNLAVVGTLQPIGGTIVAGTLSGQDEVTVTGTLSVPGNGEIEWDESGSLTVPDGVYAAGYTNGVWVGSTSSLSGSNKTGKNALMTISVGTTSADTVKVGSSSSEWCTAGSGAFNYTVLVPLGPTDSFTAGAGAINYFQKELSK